MTAAAGTVAGFCQATIATGDICGPAGVLAQLAFRQYAASFPSGLVGGRTVTSTIGESVDAILKFRHFDFPLVLAGFLDGTA